MKKVYLSSKCPRRKKLLSLIGIDFEVINIDIDESYRDHETPIEYVKRISIEKAKQGKLQAELNIPILAADTAVVLKNIILGKAECAEDAKNMLNKLSGYTHSVFSAVTLIDKTEKTKVSINEVTFKKLSMSEINSYCESGEPIGKAGGYAIQGRGMHFIDNFKGSYSAVIGLPLKETIELLEI